MLANINYQVTYERIAKDIILKSGGQFNATSYWTQRNKISEYMKQELNQGFQKAYANITGIQLIRIDLPKTYEDSIVLTQVEVQKTETKEFEQKAKLIRNDIDVLRSKGYKAINVINATAIAEAYKLKQFAEASALNKTINAESEVYNYFQENLELNNTDLLKYLFMNSLKNNNHAKVLVGLQNTMLNIGNQPNAWYGHK